jgi:hypothetical protein
MRIIRHTVHMKRSWFASWRARGPVAVVSAAVIVLSALVGVPPAANAATTSSGALPGVVAADPVKTADLSKFNPGNIISDAVFFNSNTMTAGDIQSFLNGKVPSCQAGYTCLKDFRQATRSESADSYCNGYAGAGNESAATIIYKVAVSCGINPQALLVTLQKEQGLVTHTWPSEFRYTSAMGQGCPDTAACDTKYYGFQNQVYGAARQFKIYAAGKYFTYYAPGKTWNIRYNPNAACGSSPVYIENKATAGLYYYTPYQPNAAALRAGYGEGDGCSAYGNRNFYQYFTDWFGSAQGRGTVNDPFGNLEILQTEPGAFRVAGWAIDPDSTDSIHVHVYVGQTGTPLVASNARADVGAAYPKAGSAHGFDTKIAATGETPVDVCVYAINVGAGENTRLACKTMDAMTGSPVGQLDALTIVPGGVQVAGWALDPDTVSSTEVHFYFGGYGVPVKASAARPDLVPHYPAYGANHGFSGTIPVSPGTYQMCAYAINVGAGSTKTLDCRQVMIPGPPDAGRTPIGNLDNFSVSGSTATLAGWALDPDTVDPIQVHVYVGGAGKAFVANAARSDIASAFPAYGPNHGFTATVSLPPGQSNICAYGINAAGAHLTLGCRSVTTATPRPPTGNFEELTAVAGGARVAGWALDPDTSASIQVDIHVDGVQASYAAKMSRPDVGRAFPANGAEHGFSETIAMTPGTHRVCVWAIDSDGGVNINMGCREVLVT